MDAKRIAELRELCEKATPGPWTHVRDLQMFEVCVDNEEMEPEIRVLNPNNDETKWPMPDANFIIEARTALPEALDEIERLRALLEVIASPWNPDKHLVAFARKALEEK